MSDKKDTESKAEGAARAEAQRQGPPSGAPGAKHSTHPSQAAQDADPTADASANARRQSGVVQGAAGDATAQPNTMSAGLIPPPPKVPTADELRDRHIIQDAPDTSPDAIPADARLEGHYRVTHGALHFGQGVTANKGAIVHLSAEDARAALAVNTVRPMKRIRGADPDLYPTDDEADESDEMTDEELEAERARRTKRLAASPATPPPPNEPVRHSPRGR